jgi:hypothetical protein
MRVMVEPPSGLCLGRLFLFFSREQAEKMLTPCVLSTGSCHAHHCSLLIVAQQWLKHRLVRRGNMGPFGRLRHTQILVDATFDSPQAFARWWSRQLFWQRGRGSGRLGLSALGGAEGFLLPDVSSCWSGRRASCFASSSERSSGGECPKALSCACWLRKKPFMVSERFASTCQRSATCCA